MGVRIVISSKVLAKLATKHQVSPTEVTEAFLNREGGTLEDSREQHRTDPPTQWFVALTNRNRTLKIDFVLRGDEAHIKTAYEPGDDVVRIYNKYAF